VRVDLRATLGGEVAGPVRRLRLGLAALAAVIALGTVGYVAFGFTALDALYQTVTTITTVGFREVQPFSDAEKAYTMVLILLGVGTALYSLTMFIETVVEGQVGDLVERRRMDRDIARMSGHVIVCGWGRVGSVVARQMAASGHDVVLIDNDPARLVDVPMPRVVGDATDDDVLRRANVERASVLVAALSSDAASLYLTLSARSLNPDLRLIARARTTDAEMKFMRAGADRVVNPQRIGGARIAAAAVQPHVVDFLDVVMHDEEVEFRLAEVPVLDGSALAGRTVAESRAADRSGALLLALRRSDRGFVTNPTADAVIRPGDVLIVVGTDLQVTALREEAARR
jgi:voltage-gated potassium channel